jgi:hypothetical protein
MPKSDKEQIDALISTCEDLWIWAACLQTVLDEAKVADWLRKTDTLLKSQESVRARGEFRETWKAAVSEVEKNEMLEMLKNLKPSGKPQ